MKDKQLRVALNSDYKNHELQGLHKKIDLREIAITVEWFHETMARLSRNKPYVSQQTADSLLDIVLMKFSQISTDFLQSESTYFQSK